MSVVDQMVHGRERVPERRVRIDAPLLVQLQHLLQNGHERAPVQLLGDQLHALQPIRHIDLGHVLQTVEDVLARLLGLGGAGRRLALVLLGRLEAPEGVAVVAEQRWVIAI